MWKESEAESAADDADDDDGDEISFSDNEMRKVLTFLYCTLDGPRT